jgi:Na+/H+ antiporter NhaD/arsenite permease-like protein
MITRTLTVFFLGYAAIAFEHGIRINKAASPLITGVLCWVLYILASSDKHLVSEQLTEHLGELSGILFFLLGAMTIVETNRCARWFQYYNRLQSLNNITFYQVGIRFS